MAKLQRKAEKKLERAFAKELLGMLNELLHGTDEMGKEEKEIRRQQIIDMLDAKREELERKLEVLENGTSGKIWDFSKERALDIFAEDDEILLRSCRDSEKEAFIQIKKENTDNSDYYNDETAVESTWKMFLAEKKFCMFYHS